MSNETRFPVGVGLRIVLRLGGPVLLFVSYKMTQQIRTTFDYISAAVLALLGLACLFGEPGQIDLSPNGLSQRSLVGLVRRTISWAGASAGVSAASGEVLVVGGDGSTITHSRYHVGQNEFIHELHRHGVYVQGARGD